VLHRLEIENFYSIREPQVIDLRASGHAPEDADRLAPLWKGATERAPKVVALFGANASGKSNVLKALSFLVWFVKDSFSAPLSGRMPFDRFNDHDALSAPTRLAVHLAGLESVDQAADPAARQCRYAYEVVIGQAERPYVIRETLYYWPSTATRKVKLFERSEDGSVEASKAFGLVGFYRQALEKVLRPEASVIATLHQLQHPFAMALWNAASIVSTNILLQRQSETDDITVKRYADNPKLLEVFNREIERIDLGVQSMQIQRGDNGPLALFTHTGLAVPMPLLYESEGTRHFLKLYPMLLYALETGGVAVIDELDAAIHPLLLPEILRWFYDRERNPHDAQLWMSCHNASLLEELIKEEVFFCAKDPRGRTEVYGLKDIQAVRRTDNYYRKYLGGMFGAVPQIG
jgi:hypothetical protein